MNCTDFILDLAEHYKVCVWSKFIDNANVVLKDITDFEGLYDYIVKTHDPIYLMPDLKRIKEIAYSFKIMEDLKDV